MAPAALEVDTPRPSSVTLYAEHPKGEITIEEFEICALDRLKGTFDVHPCMFLSLCLGMPLLLFC